MEAFHSPSDFSEFDVAEYGFDAVIPPFNDTVDKAMTYLADEGLVGVADFFVSGKWDLPLRQMSWGRRFFWRCATSSSFSCAIVNMSLRANYTNLQVSL